MPAAGRSEKASRCRIVEQPGELRASWWTGTNAVVGFMLFFLCGWSLGCYLIVRVAWSDPKFENVAGASAFCIGWLLAFYVLVWQLLGRERLVLNSDGFTLVQAMIFRRRQYVPFAGLIGFGKATETSTSDEVKTTTRKLEIRSVGRPLRCGDSLSMTDLNRLGSKLRTVLESLQRNAPAPTNFLRPTELTVFRRRPGSGSHEAAALQRLPNDLPLEMPSDSKMRVIEDFNGIRFVTRGRLHLGSVLGALLLTGFWCGITGVFVYNLWWGGANQPAGLDWLVQFLFLIPFQLVGLVFVLMVLLVLLEPIRAWTTRFTQAEIVDGLTWLGLGLRKHYLFSRIDRIEVRRVKYDVPKFPKRLSLASLWSPEGCPTYSLVPIEPGDIDVCAVEGLTFGEACRMADLLIRRSDLPWAN